MIKARRVVRGMYRASRKMERVCVRLRMAWRPAAKEAALGLEGEEAWTVQEFVAAMEVGEEGERLDAMISFSPFAAPVDEG